jgi:hypothetical protein
VKAFLIQTARKLPLDAFRGWLGLCLCGLAYTVVRALGGPALDLTGFAPASAWTAYLIIAGWCYVVGWIAVRLVFGRQLWDQVEGECLLQGNAHWHH